jgi:formylglycine-generating enzyme required for sulfatase activity
VVPAGSFVMGSPAGEEGRDADEGPQRTVTISRAFAVGKFEVTFAEWDACVAGGGCNGYRPGDEGWGRGNRPVINVNWNEAQAYVQWLSNRTGKRYRLLSEAEWEYVARAGETTAYPWGSSASHEFANYGKDECCDGLAQGRDRWVNTSPVRSFPANRFGLHDMHGNVYEWTEDCYNESYAGAPSDGSAWRSGDCSRRVLRGGSWDFGPRLLRSASRDWLLPTFRYNFIGFRVARTL